MANVWKCEKQLLHVEELNLRLTFIGPIFIALKGRFAIHGIIKS